MASIKCGHCKATHTSVKEVFNCWTNGGETAALTALPTPSAEDFEFVRKAIARRAADRSLEAMRAVLVEGSSHQMETARELAQRWLAAFDQIIAESSTQGAAAVENAAVAVAAPVDADKHPALATAVAMTQPVTEAGMYQKPNGVVYRVKISQKNGHPYAEKMVPGKYGKVKFEYAAYEIKTLTADMRMTVEAAGKVGAQYGACCVCGRTLTDTTKNMSVQKGIGPVCAGKV